MIFELSGIKNGQAVTWSYDNDDNTFRDENGDVVKPEGQSSGIKRLSTNQGTYSPADPLSKSRSIDSIKIQLGMKCNYNCSYCSQASHQKGAADSNLSDVTAFLKKLDALDTSKLRKIELWGGEPLVYIKLLYRLIPELRQRFPDARIATITNGSLLRKQMVDFFIAHDVKLVISHDGPGQQLRGPDPLKDPLAREAWRYLAQKAGGIMFNTVITPLNCDVIKTREWFADNFSPEASFGFEGIVNIHDDQGNENTFTDKQKETVQVSIMNALTVEYDDRFKSLSSRMVSLVDDFVLNTPKTSVYSKCDMADEHVLAVDLKGNVLTCHNTDSSEHKVGDLDNIEDVRLDSMLHWTYRPNCNNCLVIHSCHGSCMHLDHKTFASNCDNEFLLHTSLFAAAVYNTFGVVVLSAKPLST